MAASNLLVADRQAQLATAQAVNQRWVTADGKSQLYEDGSRGTPVSSYSLQSYGHPGVTEMTNQAIGQIAGATSYQTGSDRYKMKLSAAPRRSAYPTTSLALPPGSQSFAPFFRRLASHDAAGAQPFHRVFAEGCTGSAKSRRNSAADVRLHERQGMSDMRHRDRGKRAQAVRMPQ